MRGSPPGGLRHLELLTQGGGEVAGVHGELEDTRRQVVGQPHATDGRGHQVILRGGANPGPHPIGDGADRLGDLVAQHGSSVASPLGHRRGVPDRGEAQPKVVYRRGHLNRGDRLAQVGLDGQQRPAGVADEVAHRPLTESGFFPPATSLGCGADEPGRSLVEGLTGRGPRSGRHDWASYVRSRAPVSS